MGNYVYLIGSNNDEFLKANSENVFVLSARYELPFFWLLLFDKADYSLIVDVSEPDSEFENRYPICATSKEKAIQNAERRQEFLLSILPKKWTDLWIEFINFLKSAEYDYLYFNQQESACLGDSFEDWGVKVVEILSALNESPVYYSGRLIFKRKYLKIGWYEALKMANIDFPEMEGITPWALAGGGDEFIPSEKYLRMWS